MRTNLKKYIVFWLIIVAVLNVLFFVMPDFNLIEYSYMKYSNKFWVCYSSIMLSLFIHLFFSIAQVNTKNDNTSIITASFVELILLIAIGLYCVFYSLITYQLGIIINVVAIGLSIVALIVMDSVEKNKKNANTKINNRINPYKQLINKVDSLVSLYPNNKKIRELYEEMRYSDPSSNLYIEDINELLSGLFNSNDDIDLLVDKVLPMKLLLR